jgi:long-chain acyl-CoA synthetase
LLTDPCIDQAVVYGDRKPFVSALIVPNLARLGEEAARLGIALPAPAADSDLIECPSLHCLVQKRIEALMQHVSQPERVKAFLLLARPFQLAAGEVTATFKLRRLQIHAKYRDRLEALYTADCTERHERV